MMSTDLSRYIVNPGPKVAVTGLSAAVSTDSAIVTETMVNVLKKGGNAADTAIAGALSHGLLRRDRARRSNGKIHVRGRSRALRGC
jgi:gamma-glutamyltranspeptidase